MLLSAEALGWYKTNATVLFALPSEMDEISQIIYNNYQLSGRFSAPIYDLRNKTEKLTDVVINGYRIIDNPFMYPRELNVINDELLNEIIPKFAPQTDIVWIYEDWNHLVDFYEKVPEILILYIESWE